MIKIFLKYYGLLSLISLSPELVEIRTLFHLIRCQSERRKITIQENFIQSHTTF
ncbi:Uncharacterized protein dnm_027110 [Desulfonema magnum]|uniref:Uncharacterized protein n=1 Tax=Desulfonema magnum TaxID=45655 RepID=A0A975BK10_9BACT|nr:Uncharacterized protein dnm_027110 [Desulfonema magnum]